MVGHARVNIAGRRLHLYLLTLDFSMLHLLIKLQYVYILAYKTCFVKYDLSVLACKVISLHIFSFKPLTNTDCLYFLLPHGPFSPLKHRNDVILSEDNTEAYVWL
ncbi:MAG: hypothetical protein IIW34_09215, partial [Clostridia bacterium]|nr:hypothetical protein [Clostridia bacterium]